jgi:anthranilate phosphoribosyltransferase
MAAGRAAAVEQGVAQAAHAIDSGSALDKLEALKAVSQELAESGADDAAATA